MTHQPSIPTVSTRDLADAAVLLDVREQDEWDLGHAPNAVHIPLGEIPARFAELPESDDPVPVVCAMGGRSARAVAWLNEQGVDTVNVDGGMKAWASSGKPLVASDAGSGEPRVK